MCTALHKAIVFSLRNTLVSSLGKRQRENMRRICLPGNPAGYVIWYHTGHRKEIGRVPCHTALVADPERTRTIIFMGHVVPTDQRSCCVCGIVTRPAVPPLVAAPQITDPAILKTLILQKGYKSEGGLLGSMGGSGDAAVGACGTERRPVWCGVVH